MVDANEDLAVAFTTTAVAHLSTAAEAWVSSGRALGHVDGHDLIRALLAAAASAVAEGDPSERRLQDIQERRWAAVVAVPIGGAFLHDGPENLGTRALIGHVLRETERAIADLSLNWHHELGGFQFNYEASWTEDFLAAENDSCAADEIEDQLAEDQGWVPLVVAVALNSVSAQAEAEALAVAQALTGALYLLARREASEDASSVMMPWVLNLDGPANAYFPNDDGGSQPAPLRVDSLSLSRGRPETTSWWIPHQPVDVRDLIRRGHKPLLTVLMDRALSGGECPDACGRIVRACQLLRPVMHTPMTPLSAVAATTAAALVAPEWEEHRLEALMAPHGRLGHAMVEEAIDAVADALINLAPGTLES